MSDFRDATFIPATPPKKAIMDYSGTLSAGDIARLETQASSLQGMKAKVVVLPKDFGVDNFKQFARELATQWQVSGSRMLVVVDMKGHKVELLAGRTLANSGLNSQTITNQIVPQYFIPYMKHGDLSGAISNTLTAASATVQQGATSSHTAQPSAPAVTPGGHGENGMFQFAGILAVIVAVCVGLYMLSVKQRKEDNKRLADQFKERVGTLYEQADQIGQASEYLPVKEHHDLAQRVATFFTRMTTFEEAVKEVETFEKQGKIWDVRDGYLKLLRMIALMAPEAARLKDDLNAVTGGVETYRAAPSLEEQAAEAEKEGQFIKIPEKMQNEHFRRPAWTYEAAYAPGFDGGMSNLAVMMLMMNQMQMMNYGMHGHQHHYDDYGYGASGGGFFDTGSSSSSGWGDGGGSDFDAGGGSWDSGGDIGGGDFGGGGGDW